tara:strand:- start:4024 stop:6726 length:2703 start_codon:yes stop_codon:yes gene_type:complete
MAKSLVIVESPTKAKTIRKFLGKDYVVESCMGHIRDLPQSAKDIPEKYKKEEWARLGVNPDKNFQPIYCVPKNKNKVVTALKKKLKDADELILATDEDREGESISWHLLEVLKPKVPVKRMVFHEITKSAIQSALKNYRDIDYDLVKAQEARRILDRLVGYTISPLVWKKVAYGLSAGRVQSVAVKLLCEREISRVNFVSTEYASVSSTLNKDKKDFEAKLTHIKGERIASGKDFDGSTGKLLANAKVLHIDKSKAEKIAKETKKSDWLVQEVEESPVSRKPAPPFITSTLQQEANRKLGLSARDAMRVAQSLYEQGFITYMRTDSTNLSQEAIEAARSRVSELYGKDFLPDKPRIYAKKKVKGAQEAHEAIRPAGSDWPTPNETGLKEREKRLYELIWKRTMASQMVDAKQKRLTVKIDAGDYRFQANGLSIEFPGFLRAYVEGKDDADAAIEDREVHLPKLKQGEKLKCQQVDAKEHETKPPARYTEASLVQMMEKEGIGRPSTYAPTIATIQDRGYAFKNGNALAPTFTAMVVNKLLEKYLPEYVDLGFTSEMESSLDEVADGDLDSADYLQRIYLGKNGLRNTVQQQEEKIDADEARSMEFQRMQDYSFRVGRYGAYVCRLDENKEEVCASLPDSVAPGDLDVATIEKLIEQKLKGADVFCKDPETGKPIYVLTGRYGPYVQLGDADKEEAKPKRVAIPKNIDMADITKEQAIFLASLPKVIGQHPETKKDVKVGIGRFGPFLFHDGEYRSITKDYDMFEINLKQALELMATPKRSRGQAKVLRDFKLAPDGKTPIVLYDGRYGPYLKYGNKNVSLPEDVKTHQLNKDKAIEIIEAKLGSLKKTKKKASKKKTAKKKTKKKAVTKKKTAKKKAASKASSSKKAKKKKVVRRKKATK